MSSVISSAGLESPPKPPSHYAIRADDGDPTWLEDAIEDYLGLTVTKPQKEICRAIAQNEKLLVVTANGLGKSYILAAITIVWLLCRYPAVSFATSGTEKKMKRTYCKPVENLHSNGRIPLPGTYKSQPERIEFEDDPEHFWEASSPEDAGELEGVHTAYTLAIIEEADKKRVDADVVDSMNSLPSDEQDRIIAIANPPQDETDIVAQLMERPGWHTIQMSSFESHNVQVEQGLVEGEMIDGLATVWKLKEDWQDYNGEDWPGLEEARRVSAPRLDETGEPTFVDDPALRENPDFRGDLSDRWYRRRAGITPPASAMVTRPIYLQDVKDAWNREPSEKTDIPQGTGIDVARSGDRTVLESVHGDTLVVHYSETGDDHTAQEPKLRAILDEFPNHGGAIDAVGEGSGLADRLCRAYPEMKRFKSGQVAATEEEYKDCWAEGLHRLGKFLENGGVIENRLLREELIVTARVVEFEERFIGSHGEHGEDVFVATSKDKIKDQLDRSPDFLDAAIQAVLAADGLLPEPEDDKPSGTATW